MVQVVFSQSAIRDLQIIGDYIARDSRKHAARFVADISKRCYKLADAPESAAKRDDIMFDVRLVPFGNYLIFYRYTDHVRILRVVHGARDLDAVFGVASPDS